MQPTPRPRDPWPGWRLFRWGACALALTACALAALARPAACLEAWRLVVRVAGRVDSKQPGQADWNPIFRSRILSDGALARTGDQARAYIELADQSRFTIGADTRVEMTKFQLTPQGRTVVFNLFVGKIRARVAKVFGRSSRFEVQTPNGVLAARGTAFFVDQEPGRAAASTGLLAMAGSLDQSMLAAATPTGETRLMVFEGRVWATTAHGTRIFHAGDYGTITQGGVIHFRPPSFHAVGAGPTAHHNGHSPDADLATPGGPNGPGTPSAGPPPLAPGSGGLASPYQNSGPTGPGATSTGTSGPSTAAPSGPPPVFTPTQTQPKTGTVQVTVPNR